MQFFLLIIVLTILTYSNGQFTNNTTSLSACDTNQPLPSGSGSWTCLSGCTCTYTQTHTDSMCGSITIQDGAHATIECGASKSCQAGCAVTAEGTGTGVMKCSGSNSCFAVGVSGQVTLQCSGDGSCEASGCRAPATAECTGKNSCKSSGCL
jgi:hypothetical protein